jgi:hypothetical protein
MTTLKEKIPTRIERDKKEEKIPAIYEDEVKREGITYICSSI